MAAASEHSRAAVARMARNRYEVTRSIDSWIDLRLPGGAGSYSPRARDWGQCWFALRLGRRGRQASSRAHSATDRQSPEPVPCRLTRRAGQSEFLYRRATGTPCRARAGRRPGSTRSRKGQFVSAGGYSPSLPRRSRLGSHDRRDPCGFLRVLGDLHAARPAPARPCLVEADGPVLARHVGVFPPGLGRRRLPPDRPRRSPGRGHRSTTGPARAPWFGCYMRVGCWQIHLAARAVPGL
jgi:hypothetical protein